MVNRNRKQVKEVLDHRHLVTVSYENEAAKYYTRYLAEHPELSPDDVDLNIESVKEEEDHYGNGGGWDHTAQVCRYHEETDWEYNQRIQQEEDEAYIKLSGQLANVFKDFYHDFYFSRVAPENLDRVRQRLENIMNTAIYTIINKAKS